MPANLLPFTADLAVDEPAYRTHLRWLADAPGVTGIVANGHAAEVASLDRDERKHTLAIALDEVAGKVPVVTGIYSDGSREAVDLARDARAAGAGLWFYGQHETATETTTWRVSLAPTIAPNNGGSTLRISF